MNTLAMYVAGLALRILFVLAAPHLWFGVTALLYFFTMTGKFATILLHPVAPPVQAPPKQAPSRPTEPEVPPHNGVFVQLPSTREA